MEPAALEPSVALPLWALAAYLATPLLSVLWNVYTGRHKQSVEDKALARAEVDGSVKERTDSMQIEIGRLREQLAEEKANCKETSNKLEARVEKYETRLVQSESERNKLGTKLANVEGQLRTIDRFLPQIDVMLGGKRHYDPQTPEGGQHDRRDQQR